MTRSKSPTGRLSHSRQPQIQNIPIRTEEGRKIREAFTGVTQNPMQGTTSLKPKFPTIWLGSYICDVCKTDCGEVLFDAKTKFGPWATLCEKDFRSVGVGLGTGKGQMYVANPESGNYVKVGG